MVHKFLKEASSGAHPQQITSQPSLSRVLMVVKPLWSILRKGIARNRLVTTTFQSYSSINPRITVGSFSRSRTCLTLRACTAWMKAQQFSTRASMEPQLLSVILGTLNKSLVVNTIVGRRTRTRFRTGSISRISNRLIS